MRAIIVTSRKGGVGKTTFASRLGASLANCDERVLLVDCDFGVRCLDIVTGTTDRVLFDLFDLTSGRASAERTILKVDGYDDRLSLVASPIGGVPTAEDIARFVDSLDGFSAVIFDTPRDSLEVIAQAIKRSRAIERTTAVVMTTTNDMSLRAAELTGNDLYDYGFEDVRLVMNFFDATEVKKGRQLSPTEAIDRTALPMLGMVPYDAKLAAAQNDGRLDISEKNTERACMNIAQRLLGKNVPLLRGFRSVDRNRIVNA